MSYAIAGILASALSLVAPNARAKTIDHSIFDGILRGHVDAGVVHYAAIKSKAGASLRRYVRQLGQAQLDGASRAERLAFYLNAYNALVIAQVVDRWPNVTSVTKVPGFFKRTKQRVAGQLLTLDELENKLIRAQFHDARIHFALVCAARSCPPLPSRAYRAATIEKTLDRLARAFINSAAAVVVRQGKPHISRLFEWYAEDFRRDGGTVGRYLARYHDSLADVLAKTTSFSYLDYDWRLNGPHG